jgi:hypothetical protein
MTAATTIPAITPGGRLLCVDAEDPSAAPVLDEIGVLVDAVIGDESEAFESPVGVGLES